MSFYIGIQEIYAKNKWRKLRTGVLPAEMQELINSGPTDWNSYYQAKKFCNTINAKFAANSLRHQYRFRVYTLTNSAIPGDSRCRAREILKLKFARKRLSETRADIYNIRNRITFLENKITRKIEIAETWTNRETMILNRINKMDQQKIDKEINRAENKLRRKSKEPDPELIEKAAKIYGEIKAECIEADKGQCVRRGGWATGGIK